jgi:energy-coupling factor transport system substrate-specific component
MNTSNSGKSGRRRSKALLTSVAIGIAGSIVVVPLTYLQIFATLSHCYVVALTLGLWVVPCLLPLAVVRQPGASLIACGAIGVISATTTPFGLSAIFALLVEGLIIEIPFIVTLYRKWTVLQYCLAGALLGCFMGFMVPFSLGVANVDLSLQLGCVGIALVSTLTGTGLCLSISARIRRTGVLDASVETGG